MSTKVGDSSIVKVDMDDAALIFNQPKRSRCVRFLQALAALVIFTAVTFGASYAAVCVYNRVHPPASTSGDADGTASMGSLSDQESPTLPMITELFNGKYTAAKQVATSAGTPKIVFYNGTANMYDEPMPTANLSEYHEALPPVMGWAKLVHKDAEYGPTTPESTAIEFDEIIEQVINAAAIAELLSLVPEHVEEHTSGYDPVDPGYDPVDPGYDPEEPIPTPPAHRQLFFGAPAPEVGVLAGSDRRTETSCAGTGATPYLRPVVDLLSVAHCSGTLIGPNLVLTAGHCLHTGGRGGQWMMPQSVTPRACQGQGALGGNARVAYTVRSAWVHAGWFANAQAGGWGNDIGLLWLHPRNGRSAGDVNGWASMTATNARSITGAQINGYPGRAGPGFRQQRHNLWGMRGTVRKTTDRNTPIYDTTTIDISGGSSGSGTLARFTGGTWRVVGVAVANRNREVNLCARLTTAHINLIRQQ